VLALIAAPLALTGLASPRQPWVEQNQRLALGPGNRYSYALIPLGFAMWLAHYSFHFLTTSKPLFPYPKIPWQSRLASARERHAGAPQLPAGPELAAKVRAGVSRFRAGFSLQLAIGSRSRKRSD